MRLEVPIKVLIADGNPTFRKGIRTIIQNGITFQFEFDEVRNFAEFIDKSYKLEIDLYLLNPNIEGFKIEVFKNRFSQLPASSILLLCDQIGNQEIELSKLVKKAGVLSRNCKVSEIIRAISSLFDSQKYFCEEAIEYLTNGNEELNEISENPFNITNREREILKLIAEEYNSEEIAEILSISKRTVDYHRNSLKSKLQVKSSIGLVKYFLRIDMNFREAM